MNQSFKLLKVKINENFTNVIKKDELSKDNGVIGQSIEYWIEQI